MCVYTPNIPHMLLTWKVSKIWRKFAGCMIVKSEDKSSLDLKQTQSGQTVSTIISCLIDSDVVYFLESVN